MAAVTGAGGTFPYSEDGISAPYTDGLVSGSNVETGSIFLPPPNGIIVGNISPAKRGEMKAYLGNTDCVDSYTVAHPVLAGDF